MKDKAIGDLVFRPGETGFAFYDDRDPFSLRAGEPARAWSFSTIQEAADWLLEQFSPAEETDAKTAFTIEPGSGAIRLSAAGMSLDSDSAKVIRDDLRNVDLRLALAEIKINELQAAIKR